MSSTSLHLLHIQPDPQRLAAWAARQRLLDTSGDLGYALHGLLRVAFGEHAPRSFRYLDAEQGLLAYSSLTAAELRQAAAVAPPDAAAALGLGATRIHAGLNARPFPTQWPAGHVLGFDVRVRPVIREGQTGKERDSFLAAVEKSAGAAVDRSEVYGQWLRESLGRQGGAELIDVTLDRFRLLDVMRQTQKADTAEARRKRAVSGPDAVLIGRLRVIDPAAFSELIARGVGRHRAFGFGLLLLQPARR
ncbi:MAG: type I-E CRISPR-associated protein Cas6/Cse3/CasE [Ramlibacter sp.]|nr:type I-E CRISPR-associated protein Cas6/Cse3/CasE [Ramlibacter sp.]